MGDEYFQAISDNSPIIAWIHNISLNQQKYMNSKIKDYDFGHNVRYLMFIYDNPNCSQDDLVNMFCQSKGNIAKILKKFEDDGYIRREINPQNRRKYMLNTTDKANKLIPEFRQISKDWEKEIDLTDEDDEFKNKLKEIAIKGMKLVEDL